MPALFDDPTAVWDSPTTPWDDIGVGAGGGVEWKLFARDAGNRIIGELDDYQSATLITRFNDVGTWTLTTAASSRAAGLLATPGSGLIARRGDIIVLSGPMAGAARKRTGNSDVITFPGVDDNTWLKRRLTHPQPTSANPPYDVDAYDHRTGQCSGVLRGYVDANLGPSALAGRRIRGLVLAGDPGVGTTVTGEGRWQTVLELIRGLALAGGGIGFKIVQVGTGLMFVVYEPADKTARVVFTDDLENLGDFGYSIAAPDANYVYCAGGGDGTARVVREGSDPVSIADGWGRIETFRDRRDTSDPGELDQTIAEELAATKAVTNLEAQLLDLPQRAWLDDYGLGDAVTVIIAGDAVTEIIREVKIVLTAQQPMAATPTGDFEIPARRIGEQIWPRVGTPGATQLAPATNQSHRDLHQRVRHLERTT